MSLTLSISLLESDLAKAAQRLGLTVEHVKNGQQLGNCQQVLDLLRKVQEFQRAAFFIHGRKTRNELADTARIDVTNSAEIKKDLIFAFTQQAADSVTQCDAALADGYLTIKIEYGDVTRLALRNINICHFALLYKVN